MKTVPGIYETLAANIAQILAPLVEVTLFSGNEEIKVYNRLRQEALPFLTLNQIEFLSINKTQSVKAIRLALSETHSLSLVVDISHFEVLAQFAQQFLQKPQDEKSTFSWQQTLDAEITQFLAKEQLTLSALTAIEKRNLLAQLQQQDLLQYQDAPQYLMKKLTISRATFYNYLKAAQQIKALEVHQVDSFTDEPFSGNPAGVVLEADELSDALMKKIAREMNLSETAFMLKSERADVRLRYFTPSGAEVKFCGHSTVASLYMLAHRSLRGITKPGSYDLTIEANVGIVPARIEVQKDAGVIVSFQTPTVELVKSEITHQLLAEVLSIPLTCLDQSLPICYERVNQDLYVRVNSLTALGELHINQKTAKQFAQEHDIVAFVVFCTQAMAKDHDIHMRCFAPAVGIPEDPFTGSVLGGLAEYVLENQLVAPRTKSIKVEQGHFIARPGFVELSLQAETPHAYWVRAKARHFFSTEISL